MGALQPALSLAACCSDEPKHRHRCRCWRAAAPAAVTGRARSVALSRGPDAVPPGAATPPCDIAGVERAAIGTAVIGWSQQHHTHEAGEKTREPARLEISEFVSMTCGAEKSTNCASQHSAAMKDSPRAARMQQVAAASPSLHTRRIQTAARAADTATSSGTARQHARPCSCRRRRVQRTPTATHHPCRGSCTHCPEQRSVEQGRGRTQTTVRRAAGTRGSAGLATSAGSSPDSVDGPAADPGRRRRPHQWSGRARATGTAAWGWATQWHSCPAVVPWSPPAPSSGLGDPSGTRSSLAVPPLMKGSWMTSSYPSYRLQRKHKHKHARVRR
jgi:hypothetical protein